MKVSVFGLGYVGAVCVGCLAHDGHDVVGVDPNPMKVASINQGRSPVLEADLSEIIAAGRAAGRIRGVSTALDAVQSSDIALICVGTPSETNGSLNLSFVRRVCEEIGAAIRERDRFFVVVVRSTVLPGTTRDVVVPTLEQASGKKVGTDFGVCVNPEFLREGLAIKDYFDPAKLVIGASDDASRDALIEMYTSSPVKATVVDPALAEMVKYADNTWHALKVSFANEMGSLARPLGLDGIELMRLFCLDEKLNLGPEYLRPGFAFGGSCLPKDVRALRHRARVLDLDLPIVNAIIASNEQHIARSFDMVVACGNRRVGVLGLSFKAGTDDLRESPLVDLVERLVGKGYEVRVHDRFVRPDELVGANREFILDHVPHILDLLVGSAEELIAHASTAVLGAVDETTPILLSGLDRTQCVVDLVGVAKGDVGEAAHHGICW